MEATLMYLTGNDSRLRRNSYRHFPLFSFPSFQRKRRMSMNQNLTIPSKIRAEHLNREALVYVRQSTMAQVRFNQESTQRQYAFEKEHYRLAGRKNTSA